MKIHRQPAIPCVPSNLAIAKSRMFPKADMKRLMIYQERYTHVRIADLSVDPKKRGAILKSLIHLGSYVEQQTN